MQPTFTSRLRELICFIAYFKVNARYLDKTRCPSFAISPYRITFLGRLDRQNYAVNLLFLAKSTNKVNGLQNK